MLLHQYLSEKVLPMPLQQILKDIFNVIQKIAVTFPTSQEGYTGTQNSFGDEQIKMDVFANDCLVQALSQNSSVAMIGSEEIEVPLRFERDSDEVYSIVFDPLDGSSLMDSNLAIGTIIGIYKGNEVLGRNGRDQVASIVALYGPRTTVLLTVGQGVDEFIMVPQNNEYIFKINHKNLTLPRKGKIFSPGNLKTSIADTWYADALHYWLEQGYTLRYSGGMVPDVNQLFKKGGGVFVYPGGADYPEGKLRLLYECAPMALLVEQSGGKAMGLNGPILDIAVLEYHQRSYIALGSADEVDTVENFRAYRKKR